MKDVLRAFAASNRRIEWSQSAMETIAADGVASAQLSGDVEITELVMEQLIPAAMSLGLAPGLPSKGAMTLKPRNALSQSSIPDRCRIG